MKLSCINSTSPRFYLSTEREPVFETWGLLGRFILNRKQEHPIWFW